MMNAFNGFWTKKNSLDTYSGVKFEFKLFHIKNQVIPLIYNTIDMN